MVWRFGMVLSEGLAWGPSLEVSLGLVLVVGSFWVFGVEVLRVGWVGLRVELGVGFKILRIGLIGRR